MIKFPCNRTDPSMMVSDWQRPYWSGTWTGGQKPKGATRHESSCGMAWRALLDACVCIYLISDCRGTCNLGVGRSGG